MRKRVINLVKVVTPRGLTNDPGHGSIKMTPKAVGREERDIPSILPSSG